MTTYDLVNVLESFAPLSLQEKWDNSGLLIDNDNADIKGVLICLDITEEVINEALQKECNFILSHHPLIFSGIKKITHKTAVERSIRFAIINKIAIYAAHTNVDMVFNGVSGMMCNKIGAIPTRVLSPSPDMFLKLVSFVPISHVDAYRKALFAIGVGDIGNYSQCSFNVEGLGTFQPNDIANPFVGENGVWHTEKEIRVEMIMPSFLKYDAEMVLKKVHPYEEPAYDFIPLENTSNNIGLGMIANLPYEMLEIDFIQHLKQVFGSKLVRTSSFTNKKIKTIAVCGGSGGSFIQQALRNKVDAYITADCKYHDFFIPEKKMLLVDIGHFESEQFIKEVFYDLISKKMTTFAIHFSKNEKNPISYF